MPPLIANPFDHGSRRLLRRAGVALLAWLLKVPLANLRFVRWIDTRLTLPGQPERVCDTIAHVQRLDEGGFPYAIPVEFQVTPDALMFGRAMVYEGMIWLSEKPAEETGDRFGLRSVIINLTGVGKCGRRMPWHTEAEAPATETKQPEAETALVPIEWNLETLDAGVVLDQIASGKAPRALLAWVSLMKNGNDPATMQRWLQVADQETDAARKADFALVVVFAQLTKGDRAWKKALEGFNVTESVVLNEWMAEAAAKARIEDIVKILEDKFSPIPAELKGKIEAATAMDVLQRWVILVGRADSLEKFRQESGL